MNTWYLILSISLFILSAIGCEKTVNTKNAARSPNNWQGDTTIDPCGDLVLLQGKWSYVSVKSSVGQPSEIDLIFQESTARYDYITIQKAGGQPKSEWFNIVLNSSVQPKIIRFTERIGPVDSTTIMHARQSLWYKIEGDIFTTWDGYALIDESGPANYKRTNIAKK